MIVGTLDPRKTLKCPVTPVPRFAYFSYVFHENFSECIAHSLGDSWEGLGRSWEGPTGTWEGWERDRTWSAGRETNLEGPLTELKGRWKGLQGTMKCP